MVKFMSVTSVALITLLSVPAVAQQTTSDRESLEEVVVVGQRAATRLAREKERAADNIISVITADDIGSLPDRNVAESVRRIPGISIQNDQGEGRYVSIRGLGKNLNSTAVNGVLLPSPESDKRGVALDVIDSDIIQEITLTKSRTADMDGDGIGGNIDIKTVSAFDRKGRFVKLKAEGIYSESSEDWGQKFAINASNIFADGVLGVAGSFSFDSREFETDNNELDGGFESFDGIPYPKELEFRKYEIERERMSIALNTNYRPDENSEYYARVLYNEFEDEEVRSRVEIKPEEVDSDAVSLVSGQTLQFATDGERIKTDRDIKLRLETQKITSFQIGGTIHQDDLKYEFAFATSHAEEKEPGRIDADFRYNRATGNLQLDMSNPLRPRVVGDEAFLAAFRDASNYELGTVELLDGTTEEDEDMISFDITKEIDKGFLKAGVKFRDREKSYELTTLVYDGDGHSDLSMFERKVSFGLGNFGPAVNANSFRTYVRENVAAGTFGLEEFDSAEKSNVGDYKAEEEILAAYIMGQYEYDHSLTVTAGLRFEETDFSGTGTSVFLEEENLNTTPAGDMIVYTNESDKRVSISKPKASRSYSDVLPSISVRYDMEEDTIIKAAYYHSIGRPTLVQATPAAEIKVEYDDDRNIDKIEASNVGNPNIKHQLSKNLDFSVDTILADGSYLTAGIFYKEIQDFIADQTFLNFDYNGRTYDELTMAVNLADADVTGFELGFLKTFEDLEGFASGFLIGVNATFSDSTSKVSVGTDGGTRTISTPEFSDEVYNIILGYDKMGWDIRLAYSYQSEYLDEINTGGEGVDRYTDEQEQLDLTINYDVNDQTELTAQFKNITDEPANYYLLGTDGTKVLSQYDEIGFTARFGVRYKF